MKRRNRRRHKGGLYFIALGSPWLYVKIGISEDVREELERIRREESPSPVELIGYVPGGDEELEREIHENLKDVHLGKGWFNMCREIREYWEWFDEDGSLRDLDEDDNG
jgi:hypothetical protein